MNETTPLTERQEELLARLYDPLVDFREAQIKNHTEMRNHLLSLIRTIDLATEGLE